MIGVLPKILNHYNLRYNHPVSNGNPDYVILDITWLLPHWPQHGFFERFSLRNLLELVTNINMHEDYDPVIWDEIGAMLTEEEEKNFDFQTTSLLIELVVELFYNELNCLTEQSNSTYLFFQWADYNAIMLRREN